jgi:hypothetical protein
VHKRNRRLNSESPIRCSVQSIGFVVLTVHTNMLTVHTNMQFIGSMIIMAELGMHGMDGWNGWMDGWRDRGED